MNDSPILASLREARRLADEATRQPRFPPREPIYLSPSQLRFFAVRQDDARLFFSAAGFSEAAIDEMMAEIVVFAQRSTPPPHSRALSRDETQRSDAK